MRRYLFMRPILERIGRGSLFRGAFVALLRTMSGIVVVLGVVAFAGGCSVVPHLQGAEILGALFFLASLAVVTYAVAHTLWIRSGDVARLSEGEYMVVPIAAIVIRLFGEIYALTVLSTSVGVGLLAMFGGSARPFTSALPTSVPGVPSDASTFFGGVLCIVVGAVFAFVGLLTAYFVAELELALIDVAKNVRLTRRVVEQYDREKRELTAY
jgi:hypothetical protein